LPVTVPPISTNFPEPPFSDGGTLFITIDGAGRDLISVQALNHKKQVVKKRSFLFA
jgi:hypothetical protein